MKTLPWTCVSLQRTYRFLSPFDSLFFVGVVSCFREAARCHTQMLGCLVWLNLFNAKSSPKRYWQRQIPGGGGRAGMEGRGGGGGRAGMEGRGGVVGLGWRGGW